MTDDSEVHGRQSTDDSRQWAVDSRQPASPEGQRYGAAQGKGWLGQIYLHDGEDVKGAGLQCIVGAVDLLGEIDTH